MTIRFIATNTANTPPGKIADAELHFDDGPFAGLKLVGFSLWTRRDGGMNVVFPARSYTINSERRSFALLRPISDSSASNALRDAILAAYAEYERAQAIAS